ncbi:YceD family protein [Acidihalobacter prosperus]
MSAELPLRVDPLKAADRGWSMQGRIPLAEMPRLAESLLEAGGEAECEFTFYRDTDGKRKLRLKYRAEPVLRCERCLGPLREPVEGEAVLRLVDAELETAGEDDDVLPVDADGVYLKDVVEDELLLALPLIPRHAAVEECEPEAVRWLQPDGDEGTIETQTESPFDILKNLKH